MKFINSSSGPLKPPAYYRAKIAALVRKRDTLTAAGTPEASRQLALNVAPKIEWAEGRLRQAERVELKAAGAAACRSGAKKEDCPVHTTLPAGERLFCAWCEGWWDERFPTAKTKKRKR